MSKFGSYLVCKEHIGEVREFLGQFFKEEQDKYNHEGWVTFKTPEGFLINLMRGIDQELTQNMTFEIYCDSMQELEEYAQKLGVKIESFVVTETTPNYKYNYIEIRSPYNICKVEINYSEDLQKKINL